MSRATDLAWAAGFFDGEGSVEFRRRKPTPTRNSSEWHLKVRIANTHYPSIVRVHQIFGFGHIQTALREKPRKTAYYWCATTKLAETALALIQPYLITKREQVDVALAGVKLRKLAPRVRNFAGRGGPNITEETHAKLTQMSERIRQLKKA